MKKIIILIFIFLLIIFSFLFNKERKQLFIESIIKDNYFLISNIIKKPFKINNLENDNYNKLLNENEFYKNEIKELNKILDLNNNLDYKYINSIVISRDVYNWFDDIIIDKGYNNKIEVNDTVINSDGLVGRVINTTNNTSTVELLTNFNNKISVIINSDKEYYGLLYNYNENENTFILEGISSDALIEKGLPILTSGIGSLKKGVLIGYIDEIMSDSYDLSVIIKVKPYVNFNDINYISIIK